MIVTHQSKSKTMSCRSTKGNGFDEGAGAGMFDLMSCEAEEERSFANNTERC